MKFARFALALAAPLLLVSCVLAPGKFVSSLDIRKDRSFTFTYQGEVVLVDPEQAIQEGMAGAMTEDGKKKPAAPAANAPETAQTVAARKAVAEALAKEEGYRSVEYLGRDKFRVDYVMSGKLDRGFVYPINLDAKAVIPWLAVEVRKDGTVRVMALAFGDSEAGGGGMNKPSAEEKLRDGTFTLTTDATLVMQNNEEGLAPGPATKVVWKVTPTSRAVPTAVVRF